MARSVDNPPAAIEKVYAIFEVAAGVILLLVLALDFKFAASQSLSNVVFEPSGFPIGRDFINTWMGGRTPWGPRAKRSEKLLDLLEWSIATRGEKYWPVPTEMSWAERAKYVRGMRNDAERHGRVSHVRATA